jgi:TRAP-type C4-dicarboxylate transport system permease small subunit
MHNFRDVNAQIVRGLLAAAAVIIFLLGFLVCADVLGRALLNSPVKGTPEMVSMSIVIICFLLSGYAVQSGAMIYADAVVGRFGVRGLAFGQLLSAVLGILFFSIVVWGSYEPTLHAIVSAEYEGEGALRVPAWPARVIVIVGAVLVVVSYAMLAVQSATALISGRASDAAPASSTHL